MGDSELQVRYREESTRSTPQTKPRPRAYTLTLEQESLKTSFFDEGKKFQVSKTGFCLPLRSIRYKQPLSTPGLTGHLELRELGQFNQS